MIRKDELLALKLQEELDKEMAESIDKRQRSKRLEQKRVSSDFLSNRLESLSPDFGFDLNRYLTRRPNNDNGFNLQRLVNEECNSNNYSTRNSRRNDLRQTNLITRNVNQANEVSRRGNDFSSLHADFFHNPSRINDTNFVSLTFSFC